MDKPVRVDAYIFEPVTEILELLATDVLLFHNDIVLGLTS